MTNTQAEIAAELQRIQAADPEGFLRPTAVVEAAKSPESVLHTSFTWDDTLAAQAYRLQQARHLIRVVVTYETVPQQHVQTYVSLTSDRATGGGYRAIAVVLSDADLRAQLLTDARTEFLKFQQKYQSLAELAKVFAEAARVFGMEEVGV